MRNILLSLTISGAFVLTAGSANAFCSAGGHSASLSQDLTASVLQKPAEAKPGEAMSTFDPKNPVVFEKTEEKSETTAKPQIASE